MHHQKSKSVSFPTSSQIIETHDDILDYIKSEAEKFVTTFNLANRNLVRIPVEIHLLTQLERLGLNNNRLTSLPIQLNSLLQLRYLNLRSNSLKEFPIILGQMNVLEVLDVSKNKIKRFPSETDFGNLIQLRVLSISNNKIQQLPKYLHQMSLLKVFKLGHNPLVWPPNDLLQPEQESDQEVWLTALRDYIRINDPPQLQQRQTLLVSDSTPSSRSSSPISNLLYRTSIIESHSCQQNVNLFLSTFQIPSFTKKDRDLLENFVSILYGVTEIHSISSSLSKLIFFQKPRLSKSQLELESQILEQKVSSLIITFQDIIQSTLTLHVLNDLKTKVIGMIKSTKKLIITVSEIFDQQIQSLVIHPMTLNSMMASWSKSNQTLNDTLMNTKLSLTILPIAKNLKVFEKLYTLLLTLKSRFGPILTDKVNMILTKTIEYCFLGDIKLLDSVITLLTSCRKVGKGKEFMTVCGDIANESQIVAKYFNSN